MCSSIPNSESQRYGNIRNSTRFSRQFRFSDQPTAPCRNKEEAAKGCSCELCVRLIDARHLKTKKLRAHDKRKALDLMVGRLASLAAEHEKAIDDETARSLLDHAEQRRAMGYSAYGASLLERLRGETDGPAVLALLREIAWSRQGSPRKDFHLAADDFVSAEQRLVDVITPLS